MIWKAAVILGVVTSVLSDGHALSEQNVVLNFKPEQYGHHGELAHIGEHNPDHHQQYAWSYPSYEFSYKVEDPHTHDSKGQHEHHDGDVVKGVYWLLQPDGYWRTVKYHADKHSGNYWIDLDEGSLHPGNGHRILYPTEKLFIPTEKLNPSLALPRAFHAEVNYEKAYNHIQHKAIHHHSPPVVLMDNEYYNDIRHDESESIHRVVKSEERPRREDKTRGSVFIERYHKPHGSRIIEAHRPHHQKDHKPNYYAKHTHKESHVPLVIEPYRLHHQVEPILDYHVKYTHKDEHNPKVHQREHKPKPHHHIEHSHEDHHEKKHNFEQNHRWETERAREFSGRHQHGNAAYDHHHDPHEHRANSRWEIEKMGEDTGRRQNSHLEDDHHHHIPHSVSHDIKYRY